MSGYIGQSDRARTLADLIVDEIRDNESNLPSYTNYSEDEKRMLYPVLRQEQKTVLSSAQLSTVKDSVKGEVAMMAVYPGGGQKKATDIVTLNGDRLVLSELKLLMKLHGRGPFGGPASFKQRISGKFNAMDRTLDRDGETVDPVRIIVVSEEQFPTTVAHIHGLLASDYGAGAFSDDGQQYEYALCTSRVLRQMIDAGGAGSNKGDCLLFRL